MTLEELESEAAKGGWVITVLGWSPSKARDVLCMDAAELARILPALRISEAP